MVYRDPPNTVQTLQYIEYIQYSVFPTTNKKIWSNFLRSPFHVPGIYKYSETDLIQDWIYCLSVQIIEFLDFWALRCVSWMSGGYLEDFWVVSGILNVLHSP